MSGQNPGNNPPTQATAGPKADAAPHTTEQGAEEGFGYQPKATGPNSAVWPDAEGSLCLIPNPPHFAKKLSLAVAWHVDDLNDLGDLMTPWVREVEQNFQDGALVLHYHAELRPVELPVLSQWLEPGPLTEWRLSGLGLGLAQCLQKLHEHGLYQMVLHPLRIGLLQGRFCLLPSLAGVLGQFPELLATEHTGWLAYTAPEIIRTRCLDEALLPGGDIYALGYLLAVAASGEWPAAQIGQPDKFVEQLVEGDESAAPELPSWLSEGFTGLIRRMTSRMPGARPDLSQVVDELGSLHQSYSPLNRLEGLLDSGDAVEAEVLLTALEQDTGDLPGLAQPEEVLIMRARHEASQNPPDYNQALDSLNRAEKFNPANPAVFVQRAHIYEAFTERDQHQELCAQNYLSAARLSGWDGDLLAEWLKRESGLKRPSVFLRHSHDVPPEKRSSALVIARGQAYLDQKQPNLAWQEMVGYFNRFAFDERAYLVMLNAARGMEGPPLLAKLHHEYQKNPRLAAVCAAVWQRNQNQAEAAKWLERAAGIKDAQESDT